MTEINLKSAEQAMLQLNNMFVSKRKDSDIDLVSMVRQELINSGLAAECREAFDNNRYINDASNLCPDGQRYILNMYWNLQLLTLTNVNTIEERFCLVENGKYEDWFKLFKNKIIPCLVTHRLPKVI